MAWWGCEFDDDWFGDVWFGLGDDGCKGIARSSGARCRRRSGLNSHGYCRYHKNQDPEPKTARASWNYEPYTSRCHGIANSTGKRCRKGRDVATNGYCDHHQKQAPHSDEAAEARQRELKHEE